MISTLHCVCGVCGSSNVTVRGNKLDGGCANKKIWFAECLKCGRVEEARTRSEVLIKMSIGLNVKESR